jgi:hypothetical protein
MKRALRMMGMAALAAMLLGAGAAGAAEKGSFWYALDNVTEVEGDAGILVWVALPPQRPEQDVIVTKIEPEPAGVLEDPRTGNRVVEWMLRPEERHDLPEIAPDQIYFHFEFEYTEKPVAVAVDADALGAYDTGDAEYVLYTTSEIWLQTEGAVYDQARAVVGDERNPHRQGRLLFDWVVANISFVSGGLPDHDAASVLAGGGGDCSQMSVLYAAMCRSIGLPARTVTRTWHDGGYHTFAEILLPDGVWMPVDPSLGRLLAHAEDDAPGKKAALARVAKENRGGDPGWLYGNMPSGRLTVSVGNNIRLESPTLGRSVDFQDLQPGGRYAHPAAIRIDGLNDSIVHGGFYVFDREVADLDEAHELVHTRLGHLFFRSDVYDPMDEGCVAPMSRFSDPVQVWLNQGKIYMHKSEYYKAEAAFRRALLHEHESARETVVWIHNYLGNCYDLLGRRELALEQYEAALAVKSDFQGARTYAERYLKKPFTRQPE